jgi:hypothetical protein
MDPFFTIYYLIKKFVIILATLHDSVIGVHSVALLFMSLIDA